MASKRAKDEVKHEAILRAATRLFLKKGFSNTSMDAIADAARVTKQTVYSHYKSKDVLFTHMVTALCEKYTPPDALDDSAASPESLLTQVGIGFLTMITSPDGVAATRLVISEAGQYPKLAQRFYEDGTQRTIAIMAQALDRMNKRGLLSIPDTQSAASYFFAMLKSSYHLRMLLGIKPLPAAKEKEAHVKEVVKVFFKLYGGKDAMHTRSVL